MTKHLTKHRYFYIAVLSVLVVYIIPLLFIRLPLGHDVNFHLTRIKGLSDELSMGHFPVRIYSTVFYEYGYAAPLFYGDWLLYFPALLVLAGMEILTAYKTFILAIMVLAALSMYFSGKIIFGNQKAACAASVLYALSTYFGTDALIRHANGEFQSFIFLPIAFAGLYDILFNEGRKWLLLPLGMCGVLITHTLTTALTVFFLFLCFLIFIEKLTTRKFLLILASVLVFLLLSASFLFPMIEQFLSNSFLATDGTSATRFGTLEDRSMPSVFSLFWIFNPYEEYYIPQGVGFTIVFLISLFVIYYKKVKSLQAYTYLALSCFALFLTSRFFPWGRLQEIFGVLQFPWRIMLFAAFFIALFGGAVIQRLHRNAFCSVYVFIIIAISVVGVIATLFPNAHYYASTIEEKDYYEVIHAENNIGAGEFLPTQTNIETLVWYRPGVSSNSSAYFDYSYENGCFTLDFSENNKENTYFEIPLIMYKGYKATLETETGSRELPMSYGYTNLIRVKVGSDNAGTIKVWYDGTTVQKISFIVTMASFGAAAVYSIFPLIKKRRSKQPAETSQSEAEPLESL